jgi:hypothetical protein
MTKVFRPEELPVKPAPIKKTVPIKDFDIGYADNLIPCLAVPERPVPNGSSAG